MEFRKRLLAFAIDSAIFTAIFMFCNIIPIYDDYHSIDSSLSRMAYMLYGISLMIVMIVFIGKDMVAGRSIGKRLVKIKVIDSSGKQPSIFQLFIRNITIFIWPVEVMMLLLGKKRLGDILVKTDVIIE